MADTVDSMAVELVANLQPFFDQLKTGLEAAKARINAFKAEGGSKVELTAETKGLVDGLNTAISKTQNWRKETEDAMKRAGSSAKDMGKQVQDAGNQGQAALANMVKGIVASYLTFEGARRVVAASGRFMVESLEGAMEEERQFRQLTSAMNDFHINAEQGKQTIEDYSDRLQAMGMADDETRAAILRMLNVTHDLPKAIQAVTAAYVASVTRGVDMNETMEVMLSLMAGSSRGLIQTYKTFGIEVDKSRAPAEQIRDALTQINAAFGSMATVGKTAETQLRAIGQIWGETKDSTAKSTSIFSTGSSPDSTSRLAASERWARLSSRRSTRRCSP
jgi:hypothetical protein